MAFRKVFLKFSEEEAQKAMTGELDLEYTGEIYYDVVFPENIEDDFSWPGDGIFSPPDGDVYYNCPCDLKELKSFKKVDVESDDSDGSDGESDGE